jgi:tRNA (cmo5U34)-methyltransferase
MHVHEAGHFEAEVSDDEKDRVFAETGKRMLDFRFDNKVANVFDDMVNRSVPLYAEIQRMTCELAADFAQPNTSVYDLGCSTGTTFEMLHTALNPTVSFVGYDNSESMLEKGREKLKPILAERDVRLEWADIQGGFQVENASVVVMVLTLQFVRPLFRERLIRRLYEGMVKDSALIIVEKITSSHTLLNRLFIDHYYDFKRRQGYSDTEITNKREALENVLIPYRHDENELLLRECGFRHVEDFFRWYNFYGLIAVK